MDKTCPYCGGEMLLGYMQNRDGICWSMKRKRIAVLPGLAKDELYLPDGHDSSADGGWAASTGGKTIEAYNCPKCRVILMSYSDYPYDHPIFHLEGHGDEKT